MNVPELHKRAVDQFDRKVRGTRDDQWDQPTPNTEWDVRALVKHLVYENLWTVPLMEGKTIEEVGDQFEGDILGDDPKAAWQEASRAAVESVTDEAMSRTVHLSFGDVKGEFYAMQLLNDHVMHAWDLARATGQDEQLDPELVSICADWFSQFEDEYRKAGLIAPRPKLPPDATDQMKFLAMTGRDATPV